jgi:Flp pilus assembly protein TadB
MADPSTPGATDEPDGVEANEPGGRRDSLFKRKLAQRRRWWRKHLRRNAFRHLDQAIAEAGHALPAAWVLFEDRDLQALREADEDQWKAETRELHVRELQPRAKVAVQEQGKTSTKGDPSPFSPPARRLPPLRDPKRPWPKPVLRITAWAVLAAVGAVCFATLTDASWEWIVALVALLLFSAWRVWLAWRERARRKRVAQQLNTKVKIVSRSSRRP